MKARNLTPTLVVILVLITSAICQTSSPRPITGGSPSIDGLLNRYRVALDRASLIGALKNPDAVVRSLAAEKLAEDNAHDATPAVEQALEAETDPATRINIAFAVAQLGGEVGVATLNSGCADSNLPGYLRIRATSYLLDLQKDGCLDAVVNMLGSTGDSDSRIEALSLFPRLQNVPKKQSVRAFKLIVAALSDPTPAIRMDASITLGTLKNSSAIPFLQTAVANETDGIVRSTMRSALQRLREKNPD